MNTVKIHFTFFFTLLILGLAAAEPVILGQYPAPSPDGSQLAFSFRGDIWLAPISGGNAQRLSVHEAYESLPNWSPDGKWLAFASDRNGNRDVFVMTAQGENVQQLTFLSQDDQVFDWTPDGQSILFASNRDFSYPAVRLASLYQIRREGGTPTLFMPDFGDHGKISPDGRFLLFTRGRIDLYRKHYHGSMNSDIWRFDLKTGEYFQLTDFAGNDFFPLWAPDGKLIYFVSHQDGTANLWQMQPDGAAKKQLTSHKDDGIYYAAIARNARVITYSRGDQIWVWRDGKSTPLELTVPSDAKTNSIAWEFFNSKATEMAVSSDEKYLAFVVHGEIFLTKNKTKGTSRTIRLTDTPFREKDLCWTPHGDTLLFVSDRNGNDDLFQIVSDDPATKNLYRALKYKTIPLTDDSREEIKPKVSPDGKKIAFLREDDLCTMNRDGKKVQILTESWNTPNFAWSPDSRWIAYSVEDNEFNADIFIIPAEGGAPVNITRHPDNDLDPVWSPDGRKLGFGSRRSNDTFDIWFVFLRQADHEKTTEDWEEEEEILAEAKKDKSDKAKDEKKTEDKRVQIDFQDIHKRLRRLTSLPGDENTLDISPDGKTFIFKTNSDGKNNIWSVGWDGKELKQLTSGDENPLQLHWSNDGKTTFYLKSTGTLHSMAAAGSDNKGIGFSARMEIDQVAERRQMFHEAWRVLNQYFYDPDFHGADWAKLRKKYSARIENIATSEDFYTAVRMLLGELNASHLGIYPPAKSGAIQTGMLGLKFDESYSGTGLKVTRVLPNGPCTQANATVNPGEILLAIDGESVSANQNIHERLNQKVNQPVILKIQGVATEREIVVRPIPFNQLMTLEYDRWVNEKRQWVHEQSQGRVAYLHIQGMGWGNLEQFQTELYSEAHGKDGLLIDVRFNGGGWINDYLLTMLSVRPHAYTVPRGGERAYPQSRLPYYYWSKPFSVLCNQYSFSNAEIFSHAVKVLRLAKVIGEATPGAVISTGETKLLDGSSFRIPGRGWFNLETGLNQENNGAVPDFIVGVQPGDEVKKIDRQLQKAVEVILREISAQK